MKTDKLKQQDISPAQEQRLADALRTLPRAPESPWFTRKVLNRLPDRQRRVAARIEIATCVIALVATGIFAARFVRQTLEAPEIVTGDIMMYLVYLAIIVALAANICDWLFIRPLRNAVQRRNGMARMQ